MRNIIEEKPNAKLIGRLKKTFEFVNEKDIRGKSILDIGCGYGWFEKNAFEKGANHIAGIEITEEDLTTIRKYIKNKAFSSKIGSAIDIPFKEKEFDTVVAWEVLEHIPKNTEGTFFKEANRVLKKGGAFYLSTPHAAFFSTNLDPAYWLIGHRHYSKERLEMLGTSNGFKVENVFIGGSYWTSISVLNMYFSKWILRRDRLWKPFFEKKENEEYSRQGFYNIFVKYTKK